MVSLIDWIVHVDQLKGSPTVKTISFFALLQIMMLELKKTISVCYLIFKKLFGNIFYMNLFIFLYEYFLFFI